MKAPRAVSPTSWNERYAGEDYLFGTEPSAFLVRTASRLAPRSRVLAVADGEGRNGVWLAKRGHRVTSVDASANALQKAERLAEQRGVGLELVQADLARWSWPRETFDAVAGIFIQFAGPELREELFAGIISALKPGGWLLLQGYRPEQLDYATGGPSAVENLYTEQVLRAAFADFEIVELTAYDAEIQEGSAHSGMSALIDLVARKPLARD